jgi:hypothetical protein
MIHFGASGYLASERSSLLLTKGALEVSSAFQPHLDVA